jgi:autotransporter-associated beta strand protein
MTTLRPSTPSSPKTAHRIFLLTLAAVVAWTVPASAQTIQNWEGNNFFNFWAVAGNWGLNLMPSATDIAQFSGTTAPDPNFYGQDQSLGRLDFASGAQSYTLNSTIFGPANLTISGIAGTGINNASANVQTLPNTVNVILNSSQTWTVSNSAGSLVVNGVISGTGAALTKSGAGTLQLSGANTYTGNTIVSGGTLTLTGSGSFASSPSISIASGATLNVSGVTGGANFASGAFALTSGQTLSGSGTVAGTMVALSGAAIAPGAGTTRSTLSTGTVTLQTGSFFDVDIGSFTTLVDTDLLNVVGALTTNASSTIRVHNNAGTEPHDFVTRKYTIAHTTTGVKLNTSMLISTSGFAAGDRFSLSTANGGKDLILSFTPVPEPVSVVAIFAAGLGLFHVARRRWQSRSAAAN